MPNPKHKASNNDDVINKLSHRLAWLEDEANNRIDNLSEAVIKNLKTIYLLLESQGLLIKVNGEYTFSDKANADINTMITAEAPEVPKFNVDNIVDKIVEDSIELAIEG